MPDTSSKDRVGESSTPQSPSSTSETPVATPRPITEPTSAPPDRAELLSRARTFLASPEVQLQDADAKRAFLAEKGLTSGEVDQLLRELPPSIPPRTYPAPPPSNLLNLLAGAARIFTWLTGTSAFVLFVYYRFLFPRLAQSYQARLALRRHQSVLIARLTESAFALKATQAESYMGLPRTVPTYEDSQYAQYHTVDELVSRRSRLDESTQVEADIPDFTILRCTLEELGRSKVDGTSTEDLFRHLENKLSWLTHEEGAARQNDLWNQLNTCPCFVSTVAKADTTSLLLVDHPSRLLWKYVPPPLPPTPPLFASLANLQVALPRNKEPASASPDGASLIPTMSARQRALQALSDFTGYITTQTYSFNLPSIRGTNGTISGGDPIKDELRREIKALKGLVLNRRSFLPSGASVSGSNGNTPRSSDV